MKAFLYSLGRDHSSHVHCLAIVFQRVATPCRAGDRMLQKDSLADVSLSSLHAIPHLSRTLSADRVVASSTFYVGHQWHMWVIAGDTLVPLVATPVDAIYFGEKPARPCDQFSALLNLVAQRTLKRGHILRCFSGLAEDLQGLAASISKVDFFHRHRDESDSELSRFVQTEIEHMLAQARSMYDLVHELLAAHLSGGLLDTGMSPRPNKLPKSFADVTLKNDAVVPVEQIGSRYRVPVWLAECYYRHAFALQSLRAMRDAVMHSGRSVDFVFSCERGFAVHKASVPNVGFYSWPSGCEMETDLVPLRPLLVQIVLVVLAMMNDFADAIASHLRPTYDTVPGLYLYSRGPHYAAIRDAHIVVATGRWDRVPSG